MFTVTLQQFRDITMVRPEYDVYDVKNMAERHCWDYIKTNWRDYGRMISFRQDGVRINIYLRTGTVAKCLPHEEQRFKRNVDTKALLGNLLVDPWALPGHWYS